MTILNTRPQVLLSSFLNEYKTVFPDIQVDQALDYIRTGNHFEKLTIEWYKNLDAGLLQEAYNVYDDDYYFTDLWNCFVTYSRRYLKDISKPCLPDGLIFTDRVADVVVDIGCGIGYTTAALTEIYPEAQVYGINLKNTKQWTFCERMAAKHNFTMVETIEGIKNVDVLFASEYFEHILEPISHLEAIVAESSPKFMIIGNAFNTWSIGHFKTYYHRGQEIPQQKISNLFNSRLRNIGYTQIKTTLFNNKPNIWERR